MYHLNTSYFSSGYLKILSWPTEFKDFSVFSNLTTIMGVDLFREAVSFLIQDSITEHGPFHLSHVSPYLHIWNLYSLCFQNNMIWKYIIYSGSSCFVLNHFQESVRTPNQLSHWNIGKWIYTFPDPTYHAGVNEVTYIKVLLYFSLQVERLGFRSLKSIKYGNVYIGYMKKMCYQQKVNWTKIIQNPVPHRSFKDGLLLRANEGNCSKLMFLLDDGELHRFIWI